MIKHRGNYKIPVEISDLKFYHHDEIVQLESGQSLDGVRIAYHTYGQLNANKDNVIWVCHALTANSNVFDWWKGLFGENDLFNPKDYFIVCANILGSCYGTTSPRSIQKESRTPYGLSFPKFTIRDMVTCHDLLRNHLEIETIQIGVGGSCGGHQIMEMAYLYPELIQSMVLMVTSARETPWAIAAHEAQRMTLESDDTWKDNTDQAAQKSLRAARAMALLHYRTFESYMSGQIDEEEDKVDDFKAASYVKYQGLKLIRRFYAHNYWYLLKALDTHNIGRGRGGAAQALNQINIPSLVISMESDLLIPVSEQAFLAEHLPNSTHEIISSLYGHDGFLIETEKISNAIRNWMK